MSKIILKFYYKDNDKRVYFSRNKFYNQQIPAEAVHIEGIKGQKAYIERDSSLTKGKHYIVLKLPLSLRDSDRKKFVGEVFNFFKDKLTKDFESVDKQDGFGVIETKPYREGSGAIQIDGIEKEFRFRKRNYSDYHYQINAKNKLAARKKVQCLKKFIAKVYVKNIGAGKSSKDSLKEVALWFKQKYPTARSLATRTIFKYVQEGKVLIST